jgi:hypothetical protein
MRTRPTAAATLAVIPLALLALPLALLALPLARPAHAADAPAESTSAGFAPAAEAGSGFGAQGQLVLSMGATNGEHFFFHKTSNGGWQLAIAPAADYLVLPNFSVGGVVAYGHQSGGGGTGTNGLGADTFALAARAGYVYNITDKFGVWPLGGLELTYISENHASQTDTYFTLFLPVLFHPAPHFFAGLGPNFQFHLTGLKTSEYGLDTVIGGWF